MADQHIEVAEILLQALISKAVSEKLGSLGNEFGVLTRGMSEGQIQKSKLMVIGMINTACHEFCEKMLARIENKKS